MLGAGFLWASLIYLGLNYANNLKKRMKLLEETHLMIKQIKIETEYLKLPLYEMLIKISSFESFRELDYIVKCCELIDKGEDFPVAWRSSLKRTKLKYKSDEKEKLMLLGGSLGSTDISGQLTILSVYENYFNDFALNAKEKERKYSNISITLGVLFGSMMFIIII